MFTGNGAGDRPTGARILGLGTYRPARVVTNAEICAPLDSTDEWIRQRSGIVSRRFAGPDETVLTMAVRAGCDAAERSGVAPDRIDAVLLASMSYLTQSPPAAPEIAHRIGAAGAAAFDIGAACAGFCHGLAVADALVRAGSARHVLVIGSEKMTDIIDPKDRSTAFLFGDGAGAALVGPADGNGVGPVVWGSDGERSGLIAHSDSWLAVGSRPDFWPTMRMAGPEVFRWAIQTVPVVGRAALDRAGLTVGDLAAFVPHQANARIIDRLAAALDLPPEVRVARDIETAGNTSAASVPLALDTLLTQHPESAGRPALLIGFGAGLCHAALTATLPAP
ncbi:MAG TPA: beta-ketoacyl-ACP synthase III [Asanoa sp.]|jgi:3-oxoacyl-[acyl-carrier-protein] synthase-3|nr:beta-ketoacyl-ACP synthase III [Asanoa sp.]